jgi:hypothetical protein
MRAVFLLYVAGLLILPGILQAGYKDRDPMMSRTQTLSFDPGGVIQLEQSFGDVEIQGWDRSEVEITAIRSTFKHHTEAERAEAQEELDNVAITAVKHGEDHLTITTEFPSAKVSKKSLQARANPDLKYVIKAPAHAKLVVHHDIGQVRVVNFTSDIEVTNRIGEIGLTLPSLDAYAVDASVKIGDVSSDVGCSVGQNVTGRQLHTDAGAMSRQMYLRLGVGDITIKKIKW